MRTPDGVTNVHVSSAMKTLTSAVLIVASLIALGCENIATSDRVFSTDHGVTEIGITRGGCLGPCPIYSFTAKSDGTVRYKGLMYVERKGESTGTVPVGHFNLLAQFIIDSGYMDLDDRYWRGITDAPTTNTFVVMNGKRKTVSNNAIAGPTKLWAIEELIDDMMAKTKWDSSPQTSDEKQ